MAKYYLTTILSWPILFPSVAWAQVPPVPVSDTDKNIYSHLISSLETGNSNDYFNLLSDDVKVYESGKLIASSKDEWIRQFGPKLATNGVHYRIDGAYYSFDKVMLIENFNSTASWGGEFPADCCWHTDAASYVLKNGKIAYIYMIKGGEYNLKNSRKQP